VRPIRKIVVIGATGRLGVPVVAELAKAFQIRAIVRSPEKARAVLPSNVEIVQGDLRDIPSLRAGLEGADAIYINLATETADLTLPFYEEREGIQNLITATHGLDIQYIAKIGALGAYPPAVKAIKNNMVANIIRIEGHNIIAASGIPHTFFAPTFFMELLPNMIDKHTLRWIGNTSLKFYWISAADYAQQVVKAFQNPKKMPEHCPIQGPEAVSIKQAMEQFVRNYDPTLKMRIVPLWIIRLLGIFNPKLRFVGHLFAYFSRLEDPFCADRTGQDLGKPTTTIERFSKGRRLKQAAS
jgi:uncharacterized protein YbjT (DUF2867 family)